MVKNRKARRAAGHTVRVAKLSPWRGPRGAAGNRRIPAVGTKRRGCL